MRLDRLLVYLRFARTRTAASRMVATRALRRNRIRVRRGCEKVAIGDVLTLAMGDQIRVVEVLSLPSRRGSPTEARSHYRNLDLGPAMPVAAPANYPETNAGPRSPTPDTPVYDTKDSQ